MKNPCRACYKHSATFTETWKSIFCSSRLRMSSFSFFCPPLSSPTNSRFSCGSTGRDPAASFSASLLIWFLYRKYGEGFGFHMMGAIWDSYGGGRKWGKTDRRFVVGGQRGAELPLCNLYTLHYCNHLFASNTINCKIWSRHFFFFLIRPCERSYIGSITLQSQYYLTRRPHLVPTHSLSGS